MKYQVNYEDLCSQMQALTENCPYEIANAANGAALIFQTVPGLNWAGFYILEENALILGPFQGKPACIQIPMGKGVCGTAAETGKPQRVENVHAFPGHIACDSDSLSELVIPIFKNGSLWGVLDLDSPEENRFSPEDQQGMEQVCRAFSQSMATEKNKK